MYKVTVATVDGRPVFMADEHSSVKEVLDANGINYTRATLMIDGIILDAVTVNKPLSELVTGDECTISVSVKMDNAA